ncbi:hypothetical protein ALNOE001_06390 [Candidatus Methanobinarius endosymbioticus]|uniref:4Fe-4S ferredoxin-type domain-containing protein n=1 Tax=Candidatus Methanobinarius endosymbioticus TaxID=2006182 RepID=A0A366MCA9_9EURY|nr:hypothetical protein ALNOE001_06390 [Candidatus Methanobinarius endosymbioticus]
MIKIKSDLCKGCDICIESCSKNVYTKSSKENKKGVYLPCPDNQENCNNCHLCELMCPDQAITVEKDESNKKSNVGDGSDKEDVEE